ncbi:MAG: hypothetical protein LCH53_13630 [Bacteroidetes bacterium]|nr:hypothetical protein [Bacteroidota bacterium]
MRLFALLLCALALAVAAPSTMASTFAPHATWQASDTLIPFVLAMPAAVAVPTGTFAKLVARFKALLPDKTDAEIQALVAAELTEQDTPAPTPPPLPPAGTGDVAAQVQQQVTAALAPVNQQIKDLMDALGEARTQREAAQKALAEQQAAQRKTDIAAALDKAVADGRIATAKRDDWQKRFEKDYDLTTEALAELPANPSAGRKDGTSAPSGDGSTKDVADLDVLPSDLSKYVADTPTI